MIKQGPLFLALIFTSGVVIAGEPCKPEGNLVSRTVLELRDHVADVYDHGKTSLIVSGGAYHWRSQYTDEKLKELNELALGVGIGRQWINQSGNREAIDAAVFLDSHHSPELTAAYHWQKPFYLTKDISVGAGFVAGVTSRKDIAHGAPFPILLPEFGVHSGKNSVICNVIPHLSKSLNSGAVTYCYAKHEF